MCAFIFGSDYFWPSCIVAFATKKLPFIHKNSLSEHFTQVQNTTTIAEDIIANFDVKYVYPTSPQFHVLLWNKALNLIYLVFWEWRVQQFPILFKLFSHKNSVLRRVRRKLPTPILERSSHKNKRKILHYFAFFNLIGKPTNLIRLLLYANL